MVGYGMLFPATVARLPEPEAVIPAESVLCRPREIGRAHARHQPIQAGTATPRSARCQISRPRSISGTAKLPGPAQKVSLFCRDST
ncbi:hypothetical protein, partial [Nocardia abscessus]|uniref:hypothetical protein n=1 Tax=Nocardia abscessus TaxID=120957 RepID=UPI0024550A60